MSAASGSGSPDGEPIHWKSSTIDFNTKSVSVSEGDQSYSCQGSTVASLEEDVAQVAVAVNNSAGLAESSSTSVFKMWTCDSSKIGSTSGDSCSSTDSSDESVIVEERSGHSREDRENGIGIFVPRTKGETLYQDLPLVECCDIEFPENAKLLPVATVSHYTEKLLILCSLPNTPPIDEGTVLWTKTKSSIAQVFETFGPVRRPFYSIRVNSLNDLPSLGIAMGDMVYVIPAHPTLTKYVFPQELMKWKGSDASWKDDNEVPPEFQDYSDDENEKASKKKTTLRKGKMNNDSHVGRQPCMKFSKPPRGRTHVLQHSGPGVYSNSHRVSNHPNFQYSHYSGVYSFPLMRLQSSSESPPPHPEEFHHYREIPPVIYGYPAPPPMQLLRPQFYQYPRTDL